MFDFLVSGMNATSGRVGKVWSFFKAITVRHFSTKGTMSFLFVLFWKCGGCSSWTLLYRFWLFSKTVLGPSAHSNLQIEKRIVFMLTDSGVFHKHPFPFLLLPNILWWWQMFLNGFSAPVQIENAHLMIPMGVCWSSHLYKFTKNYTPW